MAVGLFGDWGSGKSFSMAQMQERIDQLTVPPEGWDTPADWPFSQRVLQVRFNAWHYVDTDLWASLATTLFDEMARAYTPSDTEQTIQRVEQARREEQKVRQRREDLERRIAKIEASNARPRSVLRSAWGTAIRAVRDDDDLIESLKDAAEPVGDEAARNVDAAGDLATALGELEGTREHGSAVWRLVREQTTHRLRWPTLVILIVALVVVALLWLGRDWSWLEVVSGLVIAVCAALTPALAATRRVLTLARGVRESREIPLVEAHRELARVAAQEEDARQAVADRTAELARMQDRGALLRDFVRERTSSMVYEPELHPLADGEQPLERRGHDVALWKTITVVT